MGMAAAGRRMRQAKGEDGGTAGRRVDIADADAGTEYGGESDGVGGIQR